MTFPFLLHDENQDLFTQTQKASLGQQNFNGTTDISEEEVVDEAKFTANDN